MTDWLLVTLAAPLASFGERAGNSRRGSADRPTRSALLGLLGAALGVDREDATGQSALAAGYAVAVRTLRPGAILQDFHTYQSLPSAAGQPRTRADALARRDKLVTSITLREYRSDVVFDAGFRARASARWSLGELAEALRHPVYALWLGRKSCPLAWPLRPTIVSAADVVAAFAALDADRPREIRGRPSEVAVQEIADLGDRSDAVRRVRRLDQPEGARRFSLRDEIVVPLGEGGQ